MEDNLPKTSQDIINAIPRTTPTIVMLRNTESLRFARNASQAEVDEMGYTPAPLIDANLAEPVSGSRLFESLKRSIRRAPKYKKPDEEKVRFVFDTNLNEAF